MGPPRLVDRCAEARPLEVVGTTTLAVKLRRHGLVAKMPRARRYRVTRYGHRVMTAAITLHDHDYPVRYMTAA